MSGLELTMKRKGSILTPTALIFEEDLRAGVPEDKEVMVSVWRARNPSQDRFYWALISALIRSGVWSGDKESLHRALKIALGLTEEVITAEGEIIYILKSIAPSRMDRTEFEGFLQRLEHFLAERWGVDVKRLRSEVRGLAGPGAEPKWGGQAMRLGGGSSGPSLALPPPTEEGM